MPFDVKDKLVIAIASSALFDLQESDRIYRKQGREAYERYQLRHEDSPLQPGVAFPFIRRLLKLNASTNDENKRLVEVVLLSRNSANTGLRVMHSIRHHKLSITRAAFTTGKSPYPYLKSFDASLFLSADSRSVRDAIANSYTAGHVLHTDFKDDPKDLELRIAFDFDGVLACDDAERIFKRKGIVAFHQHEYSRACEPLNPGPLYCLMKKLGQIQRIKASDPKARMKIRTALITARGAPAHHRVVETLRAWGFSVNEAFFLGGMEKARVLGVYRPHMFFDDQRKHLTPAAPCVHIPLKVVNH